MATAKMLQNGSPQINCWCQQLLHSYLHSPWFEPLIGMDIFNISVLKCALQTTISSFLKIRGTHLDSNGLVLVISWSGSLKGRQIIFQHGSEPNSCAVDLVLKTSVHLNTNYCAKVLKHTSSHYWRLRNTEQVVQHRISMVTSHNGPTKTQN